MQFDTIYVVYGAVFLAVLLLVEGLYYFLAESRGRRDSVNRRMRMLEGGATARDVFQTLRRKPREKIDLLGPFSDLGGRLDHLIQQTGMTVSMPRVFVLMGALSVMAFLAVMVITRGGVIAGSLVGVLSAFALSLGVGVAAPIGFLLFRKATRLRLFAEQLPDALDIMVRSLQAGHPISAAMTMVTKEMPDPIGTEFGIAVDEMTYGPYVLKEFPNFISC